MVSASLANSYATNPQQVLEPLGYSNDTSLFLIKFERSFLSEFDIFTPDVSVNCQAHADLIVCTSSDISSCCKRT